jgi:hypothetical protein
MYNAHGWLFAEQVALQALGQAHAHALIPDGNGVPFKSAATKRTGTRP